MRYPSFLLLFLLAACGQPEPVFTDLESIRNAQERVANARFASVIEYHDIAEDEHWGYSADVDWVASHQVGDSTSMGWRMSTTYEREEDSNQHWEGLWQGEKVFVSRDSVLVISDVKGELENGNGIRNFFASRAIAPMLGDTSWWHNLSVDTVRQVVIEHRMPTSDAPELCVVSVQYDWQEGEEGYHPDNVDEKHWTFRAPDGLPIRFEQRWFDGDIAYGRNTRIEWTWELVNDPQVERAVSGWVRPEWTKDPEPQETGESEDEEVDWLAEMMDALPDSGSPAPNLEGTLLDGTPAALGDYLGQLVYLDFWYIGCGPCMSALPHLAHAQETYGSEGFTVLGVNHHQDAKQVQRYLDRRGLEVPQLFLDSLPLGYPVSFYPTCFMVGRDGDIIERNFGYGEGSDGELDSLIRANL